MWCNNNAQDKNVYGLSKKCHNMVSIHFSNCLTYLTSAIKITYHYEPVLLGPVLALSLPPEPPNEFKIVANCIKDQDCYFSMPTKAWKLGIMIWYDHGQVLNWFIRSKTHWPIYGMNKEMKLESYFVTYSFHRTPPTSAPAISTCDETTTNLGRSFCSTQNDGHIKSIISLAFVISLFTPYALTRSLQQAWPITESTLMSPKSGKSTDVKCDENLWYKEPESRLFFLLCSYFSCCWRKIAFLSNSWMLLRWGAALSIDLTVLKYNIFSGSSQRMKREFWEKGWPYTIVVTWYMIQIF